jgi:biopolymer transport protein TolR
VSVLAWAGLMLRHCRAVGATLVFAPGQAQGLPYGDIKEGICMAMAVGGKGGAMHDINMTPLIDVLLVLIIIFMVITPRTPHGLDALVPQPNPNAKPDQDVLNRTVVVTMDASRQVAINQQPVEMANLGQRLEDIFKNRSDHIIFVKGDPTLAFGDVVQIIDIAKGAGIEHIGLMTKAVEEGK